MNEGLRFDPSNVLHEPQGSWERDELQEEAGNEGFPADDGYDNEQAPTNPYLDATRGDGAFKPNGEVEGNPDEEAAPEEEDGPRFAPSTPLPPACHADLRVLPRPPSRARAAGPPVTIS